MCIFHSLLYILDISYWQRKQDGMKGYVGQQVQEAQVFKSCIGCPKVSKQNQSKTICELKLHYRTLVRTGLFYKKNSNWIKKL